MYQMHRSSSSSGAQPPASGDGPHHSKRTAGTASILTLLHAGAVIISLSIGICCFDKSLFAWHPVFMSIGFLYFMTEGLISAILFRNLDGPERVRAIQSHALLQLRAVLCVAGGFIVIYRNKVLMGKAHFQTLHGKVGLTAFCLAMLSPVMGVISFRKLGFIQKFPERLQPVIKMMHRQLGLVTWLVAVVAIELALPHKAVNKGVLTTAWRAGVAVMGAAMLLLHVKARVKAIEDVPDMSSKAV